MRKIFCVLLLVCAGAGMSFAQEKTAEAEAETTEAAAPGEKKNTLTLDVMPLFDGFIAGDSGITAATSSSPTTFFCMAFAYERLIAPHFTIGGEIDLYPGKVSGVDWMYFGLAAAGRFYPMSEYMEKFFIGAKLGFNVLSIDSKATPESGGFAGPLISLKAGYKLFMGKSKKFSIEPSVSYTIAKTGGGFGGGGDEDEEDLGLGDLMGGFGAPTPNGWQAGLRIGISF